jgi:hypothetical protein
LILSTEKGMQEGEGESVTATTCGKNVWMTKALQEGLLLSDQPEGLLLPNSLLVW